MPTALTGAMSNPLMLMMMMGGGGMKKILPMLLFGPIGLLLGMFKGVKGMLIAIMMGISPLIVMMMQALTGGGGRRRRRKTYRRSYRRSYRRY